MSGSALRSSSRRLLWQMFRCLGANAFSRWLHRQDLLVLCYHGVVTPSHRKNRFGYENTVSVAEFDQQLCLLRRRFHPVSAPMVRNWLRGESQLRDRSVLVTFDDGYRSNLELAAPLLKRHGVPALIHLSTGYIATQRLLWPEEVLKRILAWPSTEIREPGSDATVSIPGTPGSRQRTAASLTRKCKEIPDAERQLYLSYLRQMSHPDTATRDEELSDFLSWAEVRLLASQGFDFGSHTVEHPVLSQIGQNELKRELISSKEVIERETGRECYSVAYPFGEARHYSRQVLDCAAEAGYSMGFTIGTGFNSRRVDSFAISRLPVPGHLPMEIFEGQTSGVAEAMRQLRR